MQEIDAVGGVGGVEFNSRTSQLRGSIKAVRFGEACSENR